MDQNETLLNVYRNQRNAALDALAQVESILMTNQEEVRILKEENEKLRAFVTTIGDDIPKVV